MDFTKIRIFINPDTSPYFAHLISNFELFFKKQSSSLYFDFLFEPLPKDNLLLIVCYHNFDLICAHAYKKLIDFLKHNKILIVGDVDLELKYQKYKNKFNFTDNLHYLSSNDSADVKIFSRFFTFLDSAGAAIIHNSNIERDKSFFCLMNRNSNHRNILINKLYNHDLLSKGKFVYHGCDDANIRKLLTHQEPFSDLIDFNISRNEWNDIQISKDYLNHNLEIIAETMPDLVFITEKTVRPLVAGMPFVVVGSSKFLHSLNQLGFETFGKYINEDYDLDLDLNTRIDKIIDILKSNSLRDLQMIYQSTRDIAAHNLENLFLLSQSFEYKLIKNLYFWIKNL